MRPIAPPPQSTSRPPFTPTPNSLPRLWPHLSPHHQQQLAHRLADLIRRIHTADPTTEEVRHD
jgi:hypothetical protein